MLHCPQYIEASGKKGDGRNKCHGCQVGGLFPFPAWVGSKDWGGMQLSLYLWNSTFISAWFLRVKYKGCLTIYTLYLKFTTPLPPFIKKWASAGLTGIYPEQSAELHQACGPELTLGKCEFPFLSRRDNQKLSTPLKLPPPATTTADLWRRLQSSRTGYVRSRFPQSALSLTFHGECDLGNEFQWQKYTGGSTTENKGVLSSLAG